PASQLVCWAALRAPCCTARPALTDASDGLMRVFMVGSPFLLETDIHPHPRPPPSRDRLAFVGARAELLLRLSPLCKRWARGGLVVPVPEQNPPPPFAKGGRKPSSSMYLKRLVT